MSDEVCIGPNTCWDCGGDYGEHSADCRVRIEREFQKQKPRRFRIRVTDKHPNGTDHPYRYGCYFPLTDLVIGDMGGRGTGRPTNVEWIDKD